MLPENQKDKDYKLIRNVSFISTVFNEEASISSFLNSFFKQNYLPEEIIFVDGGSKDKTVELL
ncbi:MAG: glycosyltransferase, partial [Actinomycetota bacterium]|nr:glycosyltransferase [Actinomycetota bacterium]